MNKCRLTISSLGFSDTLVYHHTGFFKLEMHENPFSANPVGKIMTLPDPLIGWGEGYPLRIRSLLTTPLASQSHCLRRFASGWCFNLMIS